MSLDLDEGARDVGNDRDLEDGARSPERDHRRDDAAGPDPAEHTDAAEDRERTDTAGDPTGTPALPRRLRITAIVSLAVAALYMLACAVYNLPSSTVKVRLEAADKTLMQPWFEQDWQLFAPTPASSNAHLMISARATDASGAVTALAPFDAQYPIEDMQKKTPFAPTKEPGITLAAQERFAGYHQQLLVIARAPKAYQARLHAKLDKTFAPTLDALDRLMSYEAHKKYPAAHLTAVQATFTSTPMTPFSARYVQPAPKQKTSTMLQTNWFPYVSGVGSR